MKTEKKILIAFVLNLAFSVLEFVGGLFTGSVAIVSDAVHDLGDAAGIGVAYLLEKKSRKQPDEKYTYGYARYSVLGSVLVTGILLIGSVVVIYNAVNRLVNPEAIDYNGMILLAIIGVCINLCAAFFTHGDSLNQKAVSLHMIEDVLGWIVVLVGAVVMRFTGFSCIDPLMSVGVAVFILISAIKNLKEGLEVFLEKVPHGVEIGEIEKGIRGVEGVLDVHHIHIWSMDENSSYATMHIVTDSEPCGMKRKIREELFAHHITHVTLEMETGEEHCDEKVCCVKQQHPSVHHHHC